MSDTSLIPQFLFPRFKIAELFGVSPDAVGKWSVRAKLKRGRESLYYLPEVIEYRLGKNGDGLDPAQERAQLYRAQRLLLEEKTQEERNRYATNEKIEETVRSEYQSVRAALLAIPATVGPKLHGLANPAQSEEIIRAAVNQALERLSAKK